MQADISMIEENVIIDLYTFTITQYDNSRWLSAKLQYLQCISNGDTAVLHLAIDMIQVLPFTCSFSGFFSLTTVMGYFMHLISILT